MLFALHMHGGSKQGVGGALVSTGRRPYRTLPFLSSPCADSTAFAARRRRPFPLLGMLGVGGGGVWGRCCGSRKMCISIISSSKQRALSESVAGILL